MHLTNSRSAGNGAYVWNGSTSRWWWPLGPNLSFDQMAALAPEIMDSSGNTTMSPMSFHCFERLC
jgi:hypothetical protein